MTLLETVFSIILLAIVILGVFSSFIFVHRYFLGNITLMKTNELAKSLMEELTYKANMGQIGLPVTGNGPYVINPPYSLLTPQSGNTYNQGVWYRFSPPNGNYIYSFSLIKRYHSLALDPYDSRSASGKTYPVGLDITLTVKGPVDASMQNTAMTKQIEFSSIASPPSLDTVTTLHELDKQSLKIPLTKYNGGAAK